MQQIVILGGGAAGLGRRIGRRPVCPGRGSAGDGAGPQPQVRQKAVGHRQRPLQFGQHRIAPEQYFTADPAALRPLLAAVDAATPLEWFAALGLYTRTDEAGRVYPYSNQAADVLACWKATLPGWAWRCVPAALCRP